MKLRSAFRGDGDGNPWNCSVLLHIDTTLMEAGAAAALHHVHACSPIAGRAV
jgi:hypothetical protein